MAEKIARTKIKRDKDRMYFIKGQAVFSVPRGKAGATQRKEIAFKHERDNNYIYFVDKDGDVARAMKKQSRGRKRKAKGSAPKRKQSVARSLARSAASSGIVRKKTNRKRRVSSAGTCAECGHSKSAARPLKRAKRARSRVTARNPMILASSGPRKRTKKVVSRKVGKKALATKSNPQKNAIKKALRDLDSMNKRLR